MKSKFPTLYGKTSRGQTKIWRIWVQKHREGTATIITEHGLEDGKKQEDRVKILKGKNIGRANETTAHQQACLEAEAKWKKKQDKKYTTHPSGESDKLLPMLALDFKKRGHHIEWPAYVQPKLNGIRCLATKVSTTEVKYTSREGKKFTTLDHLTPHLLRMMRHGEIFDGELFTTELTFQEIISAVKRQKTISPNIEKIQYWVYDLVILGIPFEERTGLLGELVVPGLPVVFVDTGLAFDREAMLKEHNNYVAEGFEGTIIRNTKGLYRKDFRSPNLQKYKDFIDEEFEIIGGKEGVGRAKGTVTWVCITEEGKEFDATPKGTEEQRRYWWDNLPKFIGKKLTVRYQNRSDNNIPIFPKGLAIRDYE